MRAVSLHCNSQRENTNRALSKIKSILAPVMTLQAKLPGTGSRAGELYGYLLIHPR